MSLVKPQGEGKWPVDSVDEEFCKIAADFFVSFMPSQDDLNSGEYLETYRGPGIWITAKYLAYWYMDTVPSNVDDSIQLATELVGYWLNIESSVDGVTTYVEPILTECTASVCRALGWEGNSDIAGIGVSTYLVFCLSAYLGELPDTRGLATDIVFPLFFVELGLCILLHRSHPHHALPAPTHRHPVRVDLGKR